MTQWRRRSMLAALFLVASVSAAPAQNAKLDPLARIALQRLRGGESAQSILEEGRFSVSAVGELDVFVVGNVTREQLEAAGARVRTALPGVFTAWIPADRIDEVAALGGVQRIQGAAIDEVTNDVGATVTGAATFRGAGPAFTGLNGAGVIVANVDTGVDYDHDDFKNALGQTRILRIWDQLNNAGPAPAGFGYGTEWTQAQIDALASTAGDTNGHGSHTMGTAAGDGSATAVGSAPAFTYAGMAPMADIIVVDGSAAGSFSRTQMLDGANYVFQQATNFGMPAVVNMSIGSQFGPKDGTDAFELGIDALSGPGKVVVMSAGNDRSLSLHSEVFAAGAGTSTTVSVSSPSTNRRIVFNGYYEASENLDVQITTPGGTIIGPVALGGINAAFPGPATPNGTVYVENGAFLTATGDRQVYIDISWALANAGNGTWTFTFIPVALGAANGEVDLWRVSAVGVTCNFVIGNQPTEEIISAIATSPNSIAAGAWVSRQSWTDCGSNSVGFGQPVAGNIASFSSQGPTRDGRIKPDVAGPGTAIISARTGDLVGSCTPTGDADVAGLKHTANQGTSMSAPHVTGAVALLFQKYGPLTPAQLQTQLHNRAVVDGFVTAFGAAPNKDFGWGKLNLGDMTDPTCAVTAPNGGEVVDVGSPVNLTWNASDPFGGVTGVDLAISRDNGSNWTNVATGVANTGSFVWNVTGPVTTTALLRVTASDAAANQGSDVSDAAWEIQDPPVTAVGDQDIVEYALARVSPNPISDQAVIEYAVPKASEVSLLLYDLQGRQVAQLARGPHGVGVHQVTWSGEVDGGRAHAGVYFLQLKAPGVTKTQRLVVAR